MRLSVGVCCGLLLSVCVYQIWPDHQDQSKNNLDSSAEQFVVRAVGKLNEYSAQDEACLARNVYYEAGVEDDHGKYSVAQVTLNRLKTGRWGDSICEVVYAKAQFSWTLLKKLEKPRGRAWMEAQWIARRALRGDSVPALQAALFYHADYVAPRWRKSMTKITQVGRHIFYAQN